jgi:serine/threonine protein kinase
MMRVANALPGPRYRLLAKWASGGMADVYVARHAGPTGFDKVVAIKLLREPEDSHGFREMFLEEVRTAALLNHPCIVQTFDAGELGDRLYMAMEFVSGETLGRFARAVINSAGAFPCELALAIVRDLANALDYAHTLTNLEGTQLQLVHRDVSPSNVLVSFDGMVKLLDFGIAKVATQAHLTGAGVIKGKFSYMAPEQARGEHIDHRADIYSLGLVLWQLLVGKMAFHASSDAELLRLVISPRLEAPSRAGATCSDEVDAIVMAAIAPSPDDRYQTAGEFATAIARYLTRRAAGFDATKVLRGLMGAHFRERRERLANLVRNSHNEVPLEDVDHLAHQPSIRTPPPRIDARQSGQVSAVGAVNTVSTASVVDAIVIPATVAPTTTHVPMSRGRWPTVVLTAVVVAFACYIALRETGSPVETAPPGPQTQASRQAPPRPEPPPPSQPLPAAATTVVAIAPATPEPPALEPEPELEPRRQRKTAPARRVPPPKPASRPDARPAATRSAIAATQPLATAAAETAPRPAVAEPREAAAPPPSPIDAGVPPARIERRAAPVATAGSLDAVPRVTRVSVDGSLPSSEIRTALSRAQSAQRDCYRGAARRAARTPAFAIKVSFEIDEARAARGVRISGDALGLAGCVGDALGNVRTRVAPDVGTVAVTAVISFDPVDD